VGASAAYHLAAQGADVVVVDRGDEGQATAAGAGVVFPWPLPGTPPAIAALGLGAAEHYPRLVEALGTDGYARVGGITVVEDGPVLGEMYEGLAALREQPGMAGMGEIKRLEPGEPAARFDVLRSDLAGLWVSGVARVDGSVLRDALLRVATGKGAVRRSGSARLLAQDKVNGIDLDGEQIDADAVVVAAGAWSTSLCQPLGVRLPVFPQRGQIVHVDLPGKDTAAWPIIRTFDDHYLLAFPGGRVVCGATRESVGFEHRVTAGGVHQMLSDALAVAPGLAHGTLAEVRVGFRPASRDELPVLGRIGGAVVATGLGAVGLTLGPYLGAVVADLALGRDVPLDLTPYRPDRMSSRVHQP
jgi:glycine/D-amino acid oxidase-like deaminating enzyme